MKLYCIYDNLSKLATMTLEQPNDACAVRALKPMLANPNLDFSEFELFQLGDFDKEAPRLTDDLRKVCNLSDLIEVDHE